MPSISYASLAKVRQKYPELANMNDEQLADSLYQSHYSNKMDKSDYYKQLGIDSPEQREKKQSKNNTTGLYGIGQDISNSASNIIPDLSALITALPSQLKQAGQQAITDPSRAYANLGAGVGEGAIGLLNTPSNISNYLAKKDIVSPVINDFMQKYLHVGDTGFEKAVGLGDNQPGDQMIRGIGGFVAPGKAVGLVGDLGKVGNVAATGALYAAGQNQDPLQAALISALTESGINAAGNLTKAMPSTYLRGNLSPQELEANLRATAGTKTGLGDVIESPGLKHYLENKAPIFPYSGANQAMQDSASVVTQRSQDILNNLLGNNVPTDIGGDLVNALKSSYASVSATKNAKWKKVNDLAENNDVMSNRSNLRQTAKNELNKIESDPDLASVRDSSEIALIKKLANVQQPKEVQSPIISAQTGQPFTLPVDQKEYSLRDTDFLRGELGTRANDASMNNDKVKAGLYGRLKKAAESDINGAIDDSNIPELKKARDEAMIYHAKEFAPYEDDEILRFTKKNADPDTLVNYFLRTSKTSDRSRLLNQILQKLPPDKRNLLGYSYLSNAIENGVVNPLKMRTLYENLGDNQKKALFPDNAQRQALEDHSNLVSKNTEGLNIMFNPKTGFRGGHAMQAIMDVLAGALGAAHGGLSPAILAAGAMHTIPGLISRPIVKALTSEDLRTKLVNKMLANEKTRNIAREQAIARALNAISQNAPALTVPTYQSNQQTQQGGL